MSVYLKNNTDSSYSLLLTSVCKFTLWGACFFTDFLSMIRLYLLKAYFIKMAPFCVMEWIKSIITWHLVRFNHCGYNLQPELTCQRKQVTLVLTVYGSLCASSSHLSDKLLFNWANVMFGGMRVYVFVKIC